MGNLSPPYVRFRESFKPLGMSTGPENICDDEGEEVVYFRVPLRLDTVARLMTVSELSHADPVAVAASLLNDVLKEDEDAHLDGAVDRVTMN